MAQIKVRGYEFPAPKITSSFNRKAQQLKNKIITDLRPTGIIPDDVELDLEPIAIKPAPASVNWHYDGQNLYYSFKGCKTYLENLFVVSKIIQIKVEEFLAGEISQDDFIREFSEDDDVEKKRIEARELLGVPKDSLDMDLINQKYKELAKKYHPDMPTGDLEKFKAVNNAHKMLKRELV